MELRLRRPAGRPVRPDAHARPRIEPVAWTVATVLGVLLVVGVFVSLYPSNGWSIPVGDDSPTYVWRQRVVANGGLDALQAVDQYPFRPNAPNSGRPGYPVLGSLVHAVTGVTSWRLAFVLSGVLAAAIGLVAGAMARGALREPAWAVPIYVVMAGLSVNVAITADGYLDNLMADLLLLAVVALALLVVEGRPVGTGMALVLAAAWIVHWQFALFTLVLLGLLFVLVLPESIRSGPPFRRTPAARLAAAVGGGTLAGGAALWAAPGFAPVEANNRRHFELILRGQGPLYALWATVPAMAGGGAALAVPANRDRRRGLVILGVWAAMGVAAYGLFWLGLTFPAQRILGFALGMPLLLAAAVVGLTRLVASRVGRDRPAWTRRVVPAAIAVIAVAGSAALGTRAWYRSGPYEEVPTHCAIGLAMGYIRDLPPGTPVVFAVVEPRPRADFGLIPALRRLRAQTPPDRMSQIYVYLGNPEHLLAGEPNIRPGARRFNSISNKYWPAIQGILPRDPVVVAVKPFYAHFPRFRTSHPEWAASKRFLVARGPAPDVDAVAPPEPAVPTAAGLGGTSFLVLLVLLVAGSGWAVALLPRPWWERGALSPAFGLATLVLGGFVADRLGFDLRGGAAVAIAVGVAAAGWAAAAPAVLAARRPDGAHARPARSVPATNGRPE